jgi:hypothetical protein
MLLPKREKAFTVLENHAFAKATTDNTGPDDNINQE